MWSGASGDRIRPKLSAGHHHAGDLGSRRIVLLHCSVACPGRRSGGSFGGVVLGAVIPFTLIVILPTNKQLMSPTLDRRSAQTERLTRPLGQIACREERAERRGALPVCVPLGLSRSLNEVVMLTDATRARRTVLHSLESDRESGHSTCRRMDACCRLQNA